MTIIDDGISIKRPQMVLLSSRNYDDVEAPERAAAGGGLMMNEWQG